MKNNLFSWLCQIGTHESLNYEDSARVILVNKFSLLSIGLGLPYFFICFSNQYYYLCFIISGFILGTLAVLYFNHIKYFFLARNLSILLPFISVILFSIIFGSDANIHMALCGFFAYSLILSPHEAINFFAKFLLFLATFFLLEYFATRNPFYNFNQASISSFEYISIFVTFTLILFAYHFYKTLNTNIKDELLIKNKALESQLSLNHQQRFFLQKISQQNAFARLSKGISHEIRNPLMGILGQLELLENLPKDQQVVKEAVENGRSCVNRILNICSIMLKYGNPGSPDSQKVSLQTILKEVLCLVELKCKKHQINLEQNLDTTLHYLFDESRLFHILNNLIFNSIDALKNSQNQRTLRISSQKTVFAFPNNEEKPCLLLTIHDTGCGIDAQSLPSIRDAFFTKKHGHPGLGLSIVDKAIHELNGHLEFSSTPNVGTTASVYLPFSEAPTLDEDQKILRIHPHES